MILKDEVYGLILAGGKSSRMHTDKGELQYHEAISQRTFLYKILENFCCKTFVSCRKDQIDNLQPDEAFIIDENLYGGPLNGILSAHHQFTQKAWLVLAVDLPHITTTTIETLMNQRDPLKMATAYSINASQNPEPLIAIWEPAALVLAEKFVQSGNFCPRKFLSSHPIKMIFPENDLELFNANFYADYLQAKNRLAAT